MVAGVDALTDVPRVLPATGAAASGAAVRSVLAVIDRLAAPGTDGAPIDPTFAEWRGRLGIAGGRPIGERRWPMVGWVPWSS
jgi:hypothetical protein